MPVSVKNTYTCDRCGKSSPEIDGLANVPPLSQPPDTWSRAAMQTAPPAPGSVKTPILCDTCTTDFDAWLATPPAKG